MTRRHEQLEEVIRRTLQESLRGHCGSTCPRDRVRWSRELAPDMADATAFVSAYPAENLDLVLHGLKSATPHLRRNWPAAHNLRRTPRLWFKKMPCGGCGRSHSGDLTPTTIPMKEAASMAKTKKISATEAGKALKRLLGKAKNAENPFPGVTDATQVLIQSFLVWEWNGSRASSTWARMVEDVTDLNELRVTVVDDYLEYFGGGCPAAEERADRLRATLRGVFHREHSTDLSGPAGGPKKEFREYLDSLEGMTPFVAARTALIAAGSHAVPVDEVSTCVCW